MKCSKNHENYVIIQAIKTSKDSGISSNMPVGFIKKVFIGFDATPAKS
jgi:hypothetical protein